MNAYYTGKRDPINCPANQPDPRAEQWKQLHAEISEAWLAEKTRAVELEKQLTAEERRANDSIEENVRLMNRLAAEREKVREERSKFHGDDYADMNAARNRILDLEAQLSNERETVDALRVALIKANTQYEKLAVASTEKLAAEREKYQLSQEKVTEYFDLLAAERENLRVAQVEIQRLLQERAARPKMKEGK